MAVLDRVGEVMGLAEGKVRLRWASGAHEMVAPQVRTAASETDEGLRDRVAAICFQAWGY